MTNNKKNKIIALTGGTRGIGYETTLTLLDKGYKVAVLYEKSTDIADELKKKYKDNILLFQGNISNESDVLNFCNKTLKQFNQVDVLINNAGISHFSFLCDASNKDLKNIIDTNIYGTLLVTKTFIPSILKTKGLILNISSIWGNKGASCETAYSMTKGAINQLTASLGRELGPSGVRTIGVAPGLIKTTMNDDLELEEFINSIPLKRPGETKEVATLISFLIEEGTYINGITITIDGGYSIN